MAISFEKYTNISDYLNWCMTKSARINQLKICLANYKRNSETDLFTEKEVGITEDKKRGNLNLLCGSLGLFRTESLIFNTVINKLNNADNNSTIYSIEDGIRNELGEKYDYILIDTSPSANSMINGVFVIMSDYFLCPIFHNFFSLQAINNLDQVIDNWIDLLKSFRASSNNRGLSFNPKFLGVIINTLKRYTTENNETITETSKNWQNLLNQSILKFQGKIYDSGKRAVTENEFKKTFEKSKPFIIEEICHFTDILRSYAEYAGVPVIELTQQDIKNHKKKVGKTPVVLNSPKNSYHKPFKGVVNSYNYIAECIAKNI